MERLGGLQEEVRPELESMGWGWKRHTGSQNGRGTGKAGRWGQSPLLDGPPGPLSPVGPSPLGLSRVTTLVRFRLKRKAGGSFTNLGEREACPDSVTVS